MPYRRAAGNASARVFPRGSGPFFSGGGPSCSSGFPLSGCRRGAGADPRVPAPQIAGRFRGILGFGERIRRHASCYARASIPPKGLRHAPPPEFFRRPRRLPAGKLQLLIGVPADEESPRGSTKIRGGPRPRLSSVFAGSLNSAWAVADARNLTHADGPRRTSAIGAKVEVGFARGDRRAPPGKDR